MTIRLAFSLTSLLLLVCIAAPAVDAAGERYACIIEEEVDPYTDDINYETVCWLVGVDGTYRVTETEPPVLYPQLGSNVDGLECWYWTTTVTQWVIISRDGSMATIGSDVG